MLAHKILCERNPYDLKRLAKDIPSSKDWASEEQDIMTQILRNKFQQNPELATVLVNTGQKNLHKAASDHKWSTGAELASKALLNADWHGQSLMGQLLQSVRNELSSKQPIFQPTPTPTGDSIYEEVTPMPDDPFTSTSTSTTPSPTHVDSTPLASHTGLHSVSQDNTNLDSYQNTGARPKTTVGSNITLRKSSQAFSTRSPTSLTPPPRPVRSSRASKSLQGGIINC